MSVNIALTPDWASSKIALYGRDEDVFSLLCSHLETLYLAGAAVWVKYAYAGAIDVRKALQGSLAGIAGGGYEYGDFIAYALLFGRGRKKIGQQLKGEILEGGGGAVEQLKYAFAANVDLQAPVSRRSVIWNMPLRYMLCSSSLVKSVRKRQIIYAARFRVGHAPHF